MRRKQISLQILLLVAFCLFSVLINPNTAHAAEEDVITKGVYIDSVDVSGMTKEQAETAVLDYVNSLKNKTLTVKVEDHKESITLSSLGYGYEDNNYIEEALQIGKSGNLIKRYKDLKDTEQGNVVYNLEYKIDDKKIKEFVKEKLTPYNIEAVDATVNRKNGEFTYTDDVVGMKVDTGNTLKLMKSSILENWNKDDIEIDALVDKVKPKYTREMVEKCNTLLGTFSTTYTTSSSNRAGNLSNGARLINNTVLYPGDVFSAYEKLTPFTTSNGYYEAGAYSNGMIVDSIGGGACQVTTTLYNAVLLSELEIVERAAHSMTISYVDLSMDAAIAGTWKDLKFKNNSESPIVVEAYTQGRTITFNIWGNETRDTNKRKIKFETVVLSQKAPGKDVITKDDTKPTTYEVVTQSAHTGYVAELYKVVYENGKEISRNRVNKSIYNASPRYVTVGTIVEEPEEDVKEEETDDKKNGQGDEVNNTSSTSNGKPQVNQSNGEEDSSVDNVASNNGNTPNDEEIDNDQEVEQD